MTDHRASEIADKLTGAQRGIEYPYLISAVVAVSFWIVTTTIVMVALRLLNLPTNGLVRDLGSLLSFISAVTAWGWMRPVRRFAERNHLREGA